MKQLASQAKQQSQQAQMQAQQQGGQIDPQMVEQAKQQFMQAQQQIVGKYTPQLQKLSQAVPIEDVMKLLRDTKARCFAFEIATDSTIMTNEMQEKASRNEFLGVFTQATTALSSLAGMGEAGAKLAGEVMKFTLQPYRVGREMNSVIDEFIDEAPKMMAQQGQNGAQESEKAMAEANNKLAEAEMTKAQAAVAGVQAKSQLDQADNQRKMAEMQMKAQADKAKYDQETAKLQVQIADMQEKAANTAKLTEAQINKLTADTAKILASIGLDERKQKLSEYSAQEQAQSKQVDQAMTAQGMQRQAVESDRNAQMGERQQAYSEQQGERSEQRADRQQTFTERQYERDDP